MGALVGMEIGLIGQMGLRVVLAKENWNSRKKSTAGSLGKRTLTQSMRSPETNNMNC